MLKSLKGKSITIWGSGREGQAIEQFLKKHFPSCAVCMVQDPLTKPLSGVVIKSPGVSFYRPEVQKSSAIFTSGTNLFLEMCYSAPKRPFLIGVTGTAGKSTTVSLIAHLLKSLGKRVALGGNIGLPVIQFADEIKNLDFVVDEVSSYQATDLQFSFDISVILDLYPAHRDWHKTYRRYYLDKLKIIAHRQPGQKVILNAKDARLKKYLPTTKNAFYFNSSDTIHSAKGWFWDGSQPLFRTSFAPLKGKHNLKNVCAALTVIKLLGENPALCKESLKTFQSLRYRLQPAGEKGGVIFVDDSISTRIESAIAALKTFAGHRVILIAGGYDAGQDYRKLAAFIAKRGNIVTITLPTTGARLASDIRNVGGKAYEAKGMQEAVKIAFKLAKKGDIVLLSPAAPSNDVYKNFEERGDIFEKFVKEL